IADHRAQRIIPPEFPAAFLEELRVLLELGRRVRSALVHPLPALGKAVRCQRRVGLDLGIEGNTGLDGLGLDRGVGLGVVGMCRRCQRNGRTNQEHRAGRRDVGNAQSSDFPGKAGRAYSAAALWPSRALSLWISSSAASAITVPGGKM